MATRTNCEFTIGATWIIDLDCKDASGAVLDLSAAQDVEFRIASDTAVVFDLNLANGVTIANATAGIAQIIVTADAQADIPAAVYTYEARVILQDGSISDQTYGNLTARCSLWRRFS